MAKKGVVRGFFGSLINIRKWSSYDAVKDNATLLTRTVKDLYRPERNGAAKVESFAAAAQRLQLSESDIKKRMHYFLYYAVIYLLVAISLLAYTIYLTMVSTAVLAILGCFVLTILMLVYSFREHFWYMQMKKRKLGCTVKEWVAFVLRRTKE